MIYYTTSPKDMSLKVPKLPDSYCSIARVKTLSASISVPSKQHPLNCLQEKCTDSWTCSLV